MKGKAGWKDQVSTDDLAGARPIFKLNICSKPGRLRPRGQIVGFARVRAVAERVQGSVWHAWLVLAAAERARQEL